MNTIDNQDETVLEDAPTVAYLHLKGFKVTPFKKADGRVAFLIHGDIMPALNEIFENKEVGISDYLHCLKSVRNTIFTLKALNQQGKTGNDNYC